MVSTEVNEDRDTVIVHFGRGMTGTAPARWKSTIGSVTSRREFEHGIHAPCGGDGTRVVCGGTDRHRARKRRDMSVRGDVKTPGHKPGVLHFHVPRCGACIGDNS